MGNQNDMAFLVVGMGHTIPGPESTAWIII